MVLPITLLAGSLGLLIWPGLLAATANRMAEATLRTSVNQSGVQILYLPIAEAVKRKVKVLLDVAVERLGDGAAAVIILGSSLVLGARASTHLSYVVIALLVLWVGLIVNARKGYVDGLRRGLAFRDVSLQTIGIDFADKAAIDAVFNSLDEKDEASALFALDLAERMDSDSAITHLSRLPFLLHHESPEVRRRSLTLVARSVTPPALAMVLGLLISEDNRVRSEAVQTLAAVLEKSALPSVWPWLQNSDVRNQTWTLGAKLLSGNDRIRREALQTIREILENRSAESAKQRVEAARVMARVIEPEFTDHLIGLVRDDPSPLVVREAMLAAAQGKYSGVIPEVIARLGSNASKAAAREALVEYGETAVKAMRVALSDYRVSRRIRLNIPGVLSKIHAQEAMNALMGGLLEDDRSIRFRVILAIEEMSRLFADLRTDREIVESAILSDTQLYCRRLAIYAALFEQREDTVAYEKSLLYHALKESMDRVLERVMWLLALIYPAKDIRRVWSGLQSADTHQRANATEFIDNLLTGNIKKYMLPLYSDDHPDQRLRAALVALGIDAMDADSALRALLVQEDRWLVSATIWEIGIRKLRGFHDVIVKLGRSDDMVIRETANLVVQELQETLEV